MRRSVREAIVGFTLIAAVAGGGLFWLWLRGISVASRTWRFDVSFADASGLAERSAVTYRGVLVGAVNKLTTTSSAVVAEVEINDPTLLLPQPLIAQVQAASLLGGEAVVTLIAPGRGIAVLRRCRRGQPHGAEGRRSADRGRRGQRVEGWAVRGWRCRS